MLDEAIKYLKKSDPVLKELIDTVGSCQLNHIPKQSNLLEEMTRAIISQQISTKAAQAIYQRFLELYTYQETLTLTPEAILDTPEHKLREVGISRPKIRYLQHLATRIIAGFPIIEELSAMDDETVITTLTQVKGVGRWTAQMLLIFRLHRLDVLPIDDLGIRKAIQNLYHLEQLPDKHSLNNLGQKWKPYRSIACWYLWQSLETTIKNNRTKIVN
ncbi:MAG: DNA-3-methyladenine glycosylase 2 family protein [Moorea sp. SIO3I7]|uniref:DNA-3-methyladenine glycosylase family protein n=1 Tax=Moorena sp. SIO3I6 TaxID=2607831 RepID=UPI0013C73D67|nr:DNA-3-methyladenine glycosylase [Moorena sp. SIO3I6]NEN97642.1 DNA-3-methyladenine glycosylase 2 family protein [Moorena sp. SIO3I7]NEP29071.1 DNA-3-methyladenine glycosylase 2 family protein [Moorena sp. SIO3I6]